MDIMLQSAYLAINQIIIKSFVFLFNCKNMSQASGLVTTHARIQKVCQRRSNFDVFLVDEGKKVQNTTISGPLQWHFAGVPMMAHY